MAAPLLGFGTAPFGWVRSVRFPLFFSGTENPTSVVYYVVLIEGGIISTLRKCIIREVLRGVICSETHENGFKNKIKIMSYSGVVRLRGGNECISSFA